MIIDKIKIGNTTYNVGARYQDVSGTPTSLSDFTNDEGFINKNVNDLTNYTPSSEATSQLELVLNSADYKLKGILKDSDGNAIYTSNEIDLPIESVVVSGTYDNTTKEVVLTLVSGSTIRFSVADLVSGLVSSTDLASALENYYNKSEINTLLLAKQDVLTAGENVTIEDDEEGNHVISASGGGADKSSNEFTAVTGGIGSSNINTEENRNGLANILNTYHRTGQYPILSMALDTSSTEKYFPTKSSIFDENIFTGSDTKTLTFDYDVQENGAGIHYDFYRDRVTAKITAGCKYDATTDNVTITYISFNYNRIAYCVVDRYKVDNAPLNRNNTYTFTPTSDYNPSTKIYTDTQATNALNNAKSYTDEKIANIDLSSKQDTMQYSTMPEASEDTVDKIVQYTGETTDTYTNGYFYIGTTDGEEEPTYSWVNLQVQPSGGGSDSTNEYVIYYPNAYMTGRTDTSINTEENRSVIANLIKVFRDTGKQPILILQSAYRPSTTGNYSFWYPVRTIVDGGTFSFHYTQMSPSLGTPIGSMVPIARYWVQGYYTVDADTNEVTVSTIGFYREAYGVVDTSNSNNYPLSKNNTSSYTPTSDYNPSTKKYVDDSVEGKISSTDISSIVVVTELPAVEEDGVLYIVRGTDE